jgi:UDP-GlcNAc3NAcA epimerase
MVQLLKKTKLVLTDSGGLQKEAFFFKTPCITLRDQTEWVELVENGYNVLVSADATALVEKVDEMLEKPLDFGRDLYGDGRAAERILEHLKASV